ncbi:hypothetical protein NPIL_260801 [Nephila pilipes]|uniref:Uncharacterized protein n=1 Tax=Nephila pilipes TaxID=299642 RepID=A0A8X6MMZ6_NEPPI|nr:hypothetical protein NPIL_260801 [Nephila pilipes]
MQISMPIHKPESPAYRLSCSFYFASIFIDHWQPSHIPIAFLASRALLTAFKTPTNVMKHRSLQDMRLKDASSPRSPKNYC